MLSRIYAKIKSLRISIVLQYKFIAVFRELHPKLAGNSVVTYCQKCIRITMDSSTHKTAIFCMYDKENYYNYEIWTE